MACGNATAEIPSNYIFFCLIKKFEIIKNPLLLRWPRPTWAVVDNSAVSVGNLMVAPAPRPRPTAAAESSDVVVVVFVPSAVRLIIGAGGRGP